MQLMGAPRAGLEFCLQAWVAPGNSGETEFRLKGTSFSERSREAVDSSGAGGSAPCPSELQVKAAPSKLPTRGWGGEPQPLGTHSLRLPRLLLWETHGGCEDPPAADRTPLGHAWLVARLEGHCVLLGRLETLQA